MTRLKRRPETLAQALKRITLKARLRVYLDRLRRRPGLKPNRNELGAAI